MTKSINLNLTTRTVNASPRKVKASWTKEQAEDLMNMNKVWSYKYESDLEVDIIKKHFKFVGGEIVGEFLLSLDMLSGTYDAKCKVISKQ